MSRFRQWMEAATNRERSQRPSIVLWLTEQRAGRAVLLVGFVLAVVAVMTGGSGAPSDQVDRDDIGSVLRRPLVASHDFQWERIDDAHVEAARAAAVERVLPVWDFDSDRVRLINERVGRTFRAMRLQLARAAVEASAEAPEPTGEHEDEDPQQRQPDGDDPQRPVDAAPTRPTVDDRALDELVDQPEGYLTLIGPLDASDRIERITSDEVMGEFIRQLQRSVQPETLEVLAAEGFTHEAEFALRRIMGSTLDRRIVDDRRVLEAESGAGIQLRVLTRDGPGRESRVRDFDGFLGVDEVTTYLERQAALEGGLADPNVRQALHQVAEQLVQANTQFNESETRARREAAAAAVEADAQVQKFRRGQIILDAGRVVTEETVEIVLAMRRSAERTPNRLWMLLGLAVLVSLVSLPLVGFSVRHLPLFSRRVRDLLMMGTLLVLHLLLTRVAIFVAHVVIEAGVMLPPEALLVLVPFATGAMIVRLLTTAENALVYAIMYALLVGVLFQFELTWVIFALVASIAGSSAVGVSLSRTEVMRAGLVVGGAMMGLTVALGFMLATLEGQQILIVGLMALLSGVISALIVFAFMPLLEQIFGYTTSFRLLELANLNHPTLRELILQAPGSYHHSMMVGQLVEAACEAIGANALLGRVGSYFHDIGKAKNPKYFGENVQNRDNPHDRLRPHMSALIIKAHVKDGVDMARQHKLPPEIIDFIREHHGNSLIEFFYHRARTESDSEVDEHDYRYPGPRPQSRETAICLLADGIEAASRTLPDPTPARIAQLVNKMINRAFSDGQLEECDLTLRDLNLIAQAFIKRLTAFYHHRPEYPEIRKSQQLRAQRRSTPASGGAAVSGSQSGPQSGPRADAPATSGADEESHDRGDDGDLPPEGDPPDDDFPGEESGVHLRRLGL